MEKYLENFGKILEPKVLMTSVRVLLLPSIRKAMVRASKSLMLVVGWSGVVVACLIIVSLQVLSFDNLNFELLSSDLDLDHGLDTGS